VSQEIRVLLADDSATMRRALTMLLAQDPRLEVVGTARDGEEVLQMARFLKPDVISMDVQMPKLDGLEATRQIMDSCPARIVVVSSHSADAEMNLSFNAIQAGALEIFAKPSVSSPAELTVWGNHLADLLVKVAEMPLKLIQPSGAPSSVALDPPAFPIEIFGLVASTGGPPVLVELLSKLPAKLPIPLLIAQHITQGFTDGFQRWLSRSCLLKVEVAEAEKRPQPGHVYLAPDGRHLEVEKGVFKTQNPTIGFCPSGNRLLSSLARNYGSRAGGAVLTGMGEDGGRGLLEINRAGGVTAAQDESSSLVYGMPRFAKESGAAQRILSPDELALLIVGICQARMERVQ
jgi:two-component system, chemotaxis family, protein-glutamate methylesterase/glutaminase